MRNVEDVLVVGYGYAGRRFATALRYLESEGFPVRVVGVCDTDADRLPPGEAGFTDLAQALRVLRPSVVCVTVNETRHADVYQTLAGYDRALVLSEKPLTADAGQGARAAADLAGHGFSMNLVERFSPVVRDCAHWLDRNGPFELLRVETFWGKHRIGDARPTMGVLSELIHPLDLIQRLFPGQPLEVLHAQGVESDIDEASPATLDSLDVTARLGRAPVLLHSSYAWPKRVRTVSALLNSQQSGLHRVNLVFDTPHWDCDALEVVAIAPDGHYQVVHESQTLSEDVPEPVRGVAKVVEYIRCSVRDWRSGAPEGADAELVGLRTALELQNTLSRMATTADARLVQAQYRGSTVGI